jgi:2,3-bisphosphoglycerate-independent phosphoglycerate mutase
MNHLELLARLAQPADSKIVLLVLDGVGDLATAEQPQTALEAARTPNLDRLAQRASLGRIVPVALGVTPGSGPGHLALFGFDPTEPEADIGRGVLEALGEGIDIRPGDLAARGNFATADARGNLTDRRAGRIPTAECERLVEIINPRLPQSAELEARVYAGEGHRFVLHLRGPWLSPLVSDTDPQQLGVPPKPLVALAPEGKKTAERLRPIVAAIEAAIAQEPKANRALLRGFAGLPHLQPMGELYKLRLGAFAGYPLYRGAAKACGMEIVPCGKKIAQIVEAVAANWQRFDYFFLHVKQTDQAGEDGDLAQKTAAIEEVDAALPRLLELGPTALAITGDHSTPAPMKAHSFHPVPVLIASPVAFVDDSRRFTEKEALRGHLGTVPSRDLMGLLLAHAGRLAKYGA